MGRLLYLFLMWLIGIGAMPVWAEGPTVTLESCHISWAGLTTGQYVKYYKTQVSPSVHLDLSRGVHTWPATVTGLSCQQLGIDEPGQWYIHVWIVTDHLYATKIAILPVHLVVTPTEIG